MSCRFIGHLLRCLLHSTGYNISVIVVTQPMDWLSVVLRSNRCSVWCGAAAAGGKRDVLCPSMRSVHVSAN